MNSTNQIQQPSVKEVDHVLNNVQNTALMCKAFFDDSPLFSRNERKLKLQFFVIMSQ